MMSESSGVCEPGISYCLSLRKRPLEENEKFVVVPGVENEMNGAWENVKTSVWGICCVEENGYVGESEMSGAFG